MRMRKLSYRSIYIHVLSPCDNENDFILLLSTTLNIFVMDNVVTTPWHQQYEDNVALKGKNFLDNGFD